MKIIVIPADQLEEMMIRLLKQHAGINIPPPAIVQEYIAIDKAMIRYNLKRSYLYRLSSKRIVSTRKVAKMIQFNVKELEAYLNSKIKKSATVLNDELTNNLIIAQNRKKSL